MVLQINLTVQHQTWNTCCFVGDLLINCVIICYLPPIKGTRKLHWVKPATIVGAVNSTNGFLRFNSCQDVLQIQAVDRPSAAAILASRSLVVEPGLQTVWIVCTPLVRVVNKSWVRSWWFQICLILTPIWGNDPHFDQCFSNGLKPPTKWVETTNQTNHGFIFKSPLFILVHYILQWIAWETSIL